MIILKNAFVFSFSKHREFDRYWLLINENKITDMVRSKDARAAEKTKAWTDKYGSDAEVVDCTNKLVMPPFFNACLKSEGALIHYLLRGRHYEIHSGDIYTDLIFNYIYQELQHGEINTDLDNIYTYSFSRNLKSGIASFNEFSLRKDSNHLSHIAAALKITGQSATVCYSLRQDAETFKEYRNLSPSYYLTDENQLTIFDISNITELRSRKGAKLFLEVATNKEVTDNFRHTFQKPVIKYLDEYSLIDSNTFLINPLYLSYDELKIIKDKGASVIICPRDLLYFTHRYFPVDDLINLGINYTIGTGWLGEDLFKDLRYFRNKYKELNLSSIDLLRAITLIPHDMFSGSGQAAEEVYCIDINKNADFVMADFSDVRFQFFPENMEFGSICDYLVDNLTSFSFSDVILGGKYKMRDGKLVNTNEDELIKSVAVTRERLYKVGKYEQLTERRKQRERVEEGSAVVEDVNEIKLFSDADGITETESIDNKEEFRIKSRISTTRKRVPASQKNLFEDMEPSTLLQAEDYSETPEFNLLFTEVKEAAELQDELIHTKLIDEKIMKQTNVVKKTDKKTPAAESKIELPKNVKLRFGDD